MFLEQLQLVTACSVSRGPVQPRKYLWPDADSSSIDRSIHNRQLLLLSGTEDWQMHSGHFRRLYIIFCYLFQLIIDSFDVYIPFSAAKPSINHCA